MARRRTASQPAEDCWDGLLLVDKPSGPTSHDVVDRVRRATGESRVGHAGTLDPAASGLLPLALGRATRLLRFLPASPKVYAGKLRLGITTDTDDLTGQVVLAHPGPLPEPSLVLAAARALEGRQLQRPPAYSARKVGGVRSYRLARRGVAVSAAPREVEIVLLALVPIAADEYDFEVRVSAGTYIRALARDLGEALGCGATLAALRRTAIGPLSISSAVVLPEDALGGRDLLRASLIAPEHMPLALPAASLGDRAACERFSAGRAVDASHDAGSEGLLVRVLDPAGALLGIAERSHGRLHPRVVVALAGSMKAGAGG